MEAIFAYYPALSTAWLAGWQFRVSYDVCAQAPFFHSPAAEGIRDLTKGYYK